MDGWGLMLDRLLGFFLSDPVAMKGENYAIMRERERAPEGDARGRLELDGAHFAPPWCLSRTNDNDKMCRAAKVVFN